ncbi:MAG: hypothetical protein VXW28_02595 [Candidatus Thermoplasmatota archaeon]|nr:hypothetical protein [Candidatus Thermoplasmatota archaeon]
MFKQQCLAVILISIIFIAPLGNFNDSNKTETLADITINESGTLNGWPDVPTWRIGDRYTYETQFDVQQLIQQANVSATLNTLTGDTVYEVADIFFITIDNVQTLVYKMDISGSFTSGNNGAYIEDTPVGDANGRLDIEYSGEDIIRVRDLAVVNSDFTLDVEFAPFNLGFLSANLATISFDTAYSPPKEKNDFPLHTGDQWYMDFFASTTAGGSSDYFDPTEFDTAGPENNSWQITANGIPTEDGKNIAYGGCDDSYKINEWNQTGVSQGFNWYCPDVRYNSWMRVSNAAGFTIDWLLKRYEPVASSGVNPTSNPGSRNIEIDIGFQGVATLPNAEQTISIDYSGPSGVQPNTNLQLRYELDETLLNPTTDANGQTTATFNSSDVVDTTNSSDDFSSNGLIVWDPQSEIIGAATIVIDLSLTPVDLIAQSDAIIVTRTRDGVESTLTKSIGYNSLPGDLLSFSIPTQNRGLLSSSATTIQVTTPDGTVISEPLPSIPSYGEARIDVDWTVPADESIGFQNLLIEVDPDELVSEDSNRTNNLANVEVFVGRTPTALVTVTDGVYTRENVTIDASASYDEDGGDVTCRFTITWRLPDGFENYDTDNCIIDYNWSDDGIWNVMVTVIDDELDTDIIDVTATVLNRAPVVDLNVPESIEVNQFFTADASGSYDNDTKRPSEQFPVDITWPGLVCFDGDNTGTLCTILANEEGPMTITAVATDDDGAQTNISKTVNVLNAAPTLSQPELWKAGQNQSIDSMGYWNLNEDETVILRAVADDTPLDKDTVIVEWMPSDMDENWTITTVGPSSQTTVSWPTSGLHTLSVVAYDNDNTKSEIRTGIVNISNVPPTIATLGSTQPIFEDNNITFTAEVTDTASDYDTLEICWDLDSLSDSDEDGFADNDCEITGPEMTASWSTTGVRWITATVTDDDGASDSTSINVSVINSAPRAKITNSTDVLALNEGDNLTLSGITTIDTAYDKLSLIYAWDSNHIDSDLDGENTGDVDHYGAEWIINDLPPGTWLISMTATDDNGESNTATIEIVVKAKPADGFLESITNAVGGVGTLVIGILAIIVIGLAAFLLFTRNSGSSSDKYSDYDLSGTTSSQFNEPISTPGADAGFGLYQQDSIQSDPYAAYNTQPQADPYATYNPQAQVTSQPDPYATYDAKSQPTNQTPVNPQPAPVTNQVPPLPATGLPEGWTMEQWEYYGAQYIAAQTPNNTQNQPTITDTTSQSASNSLNNILDDLDL